MVLGGKNEKVSRIQFVPFRINFYNILLANIHIQNQDYKYTHRCNYRFYANSGLAEYRAI